MILKESELDDPDLIKPVLGNPYSEAGKLLTSTGSTIYFVKEITDLEGHPLPLKREEMKAIFQRYDKGLMLHLTKSNYRNGILISENALQNIRITRFETERSENKSSLSSRVISSLPKFLANLFKYSIRETHLYITTDFFKAKMITSYSSYDSQVKYFSGLGYNEKIEIKI